MQPLLIVARDEAIEITENIFTDPAFKSTGRKREQSILDRNQRAVIDISIRKCRQFADFAVVEQSQVNQLANIDEHLITGERGQRLVRRIAVSGRAERQKLPY